MLRAGSGLVIERDSSMRLIWKFPVFKDGEITPRSRIQMPKGAEILSIQLQDGAIKVWAMVNPDAELISRWFHVVGTGHEIDFAWKNYKFIGTVQQGRYVWHFWLEDETW